MTVQQLIQELSKFDPQLPVGADDGDTIFDIENVSTEETPNFDEEGEYTSSSIAQVLLKIH